MTANYAVILQYPKDNKLEENRVTFFETFSEADAWRKAQGEDWLKVFRVVPAGDDMYAKAYFDIQQVLDDALGTEEEDGAGAGIVADVMLLERRYKAALQELRALGHEEIADQVSAVQLPDPFEGAGS